MGYNFTDPADRQRAREENPGWIVDDSGMYNPNTGQEVGSSGEVVRNTGPAFKSQTPAAPAGFSGPNGSLYGQMYQNAADASGAAAPGGKTMAPPTKPQTQPAGAGAQATQTGQWATGLPNNQATPQNIEDVRQANLYDTSDPLTALRNVMLDMGINLVSPYGSSLMRLAPGLANAFRVTNSVGAATPATQINEPDMFRHYLGSVLSGSGSGGLFGALRGAAQQATSPEFAQSLVQAGNQRNVPGAPPINPFLQQLLTAGLAGDPQAMAGLMTSLLSPFMSRGLGQAYGQTIAERGQAAMRNPDLFAAGNTPGTSNDAFYKFIMGIP